MAFKYMAKSLVQDETLKADGGCLSISIQDFGAGSSFTLNDGDEVQVRDGKSVVFNHTSQLDVAFVTCKSGKIDVLIEYVN